MIHRPDALPPYDAPMGRVSHATRIGGMRAIVFDLFGTLSDPAVEVSRREFVARTAVALGVAEEVFWGRLSASFGDRIVGRLGGTRETLSHLARQCGVTPSQEQLDNAERAHQESARLLRAPRNGALDVLTELRRRGFAIAMLSDCSSEVAEGWSTSPYADLVDVAVLSWHQGQRKPDPRLYATVSNRLFISAEQCWYVGDGGGRELSGARAAGMVPVLVTNELVPHAASHRINADDFMPDHQVADLDELLQIVGRAEPSHSRSPGGPPPITLHASGPVRP